MSAARIRHYILDRDGVLNQEPESGWLSDSSEWRWEDGSLDAVRRLSASGALISVVTNQSGVGRGVISRADVERIHEWLISELANEGVELAGVFVCPHSPAENCSCRKPLPGLVQAAVDKSGIPLAETVLIGDDRRDLEAGRAAGLEVVLVCTGKGSRFRDQAGPDTLVFGNLLEAVSSILERDRVPPSRV